MGNKIPYQIIEENSHTSLQASVNKLIEEGYTPTGGGSVIKNPLQRYEHIYYQAMVKKEEIEH